mmetsp:Transcript_12899/g.25820  ORF Transcript_12899/g.25820 Transcript_12899/m.25820 type:complete len:198 (+) Transcript_12899:721-1314(+)
MGEDAVELKHISWKDEGWIARAGVLTTLNALDYFSNSPFFIGSARRDDLIASRRTQRLETSDGSIQYVLQDAQPPHLFVIRQETKTDAGYDMPVAAYYILDGTVYQSPSLYDVFYSRFKRCAFKIKETMSFLAEDLNPISGGSKQDVNMYDRLLSLEARQQEEFSSNTEIYIRSDHIISAILSSEYQLPTIRDDMAD